MSLFSQTNDRQQYRLWKEAGKGRLEDPQISYPLSGSPICADSYLGKFLSLSQAGRADTKGHVEKPLHSLPSTQTFRCPAWVKGPVPLGLMLSRAWGGVVQGFCPHQCGYHPAPGGQGVLSALCPRPSLSRAENSLSTERGLPEHASPKPDKQLNKTALFWKHLALGPRGRASQRCPLP